MVGTVGLWLFFLTWFLYSSQLVCPTVIKQAYLALLCLALFVFVVFFQRRRIGQGELGLFWPLLAFLAWHWLSLLWAEKRWATLAGLQRVSLFALATWGSYFLFIAYPLCRERFLRHLQIAGALLALVYLPLLTVGKPPHQPAGFCFPFGNPNVAGAFFAVPVALGLSQALLLWRANRRRAMGHLALALLPALVIAIAGVKAAFVGLAAAGSLFLFLQIPRSRFLLLGGWLVGALLLWRYWEKLPGHVWPSVEVRMWIWQGTCGLIHHSLARSLLGWGTGNFWAVYPDFELPQSFATYYNAEVALFPHNFFLELLAEVGWIGLGLFLWLWIWAARQTWHLWQVQSGAHPGAPLLRNDQAASAALSMLIAIVALLVAAQFCVPFSYPEIQLLGALALGWFASFANDSPAKKSHGRATAIFLCAALALAVFCAYLALGMVRFHYFYKKALTQARVDLEITTARLMCVPTPPYEDLYTLNWRSQVAQIITDQLPQHPELASEAQTQFRWLIQHLARFGQVQLHYAIFLAQNGRLHEAREFFLAAADHNPFSPQLWQYWSIACAHRHLSPELMLHTGEKYRQRFGHDGALLLGMAFACAHLQRHEEARHWLQEAQQWAQRRLTRWPEDRAQTVALLAEEGLKSYRAGQSSKRPKPK